MSTGTNEATDDRAALGARIAEAMGWVKCHNFTYQCWRRPDGQHEVGWNPKALVTWEGYGIVDAWMREQGWKKHVMWLSNSTVLVDYWRGFGPPGQHMDTDEPLAAIQAALKALEARE